MRLSFYVLTLAFFVGVAWRSLFDVGMLDIGVLLATGLSVFVVGLVRQAHLALYIVLALLACTAGLVRTEFAYQYFEASQVFADGLVIAHTAVVSAEPDVRDTYTVLRLDIDTRERTIRLRAKVPHYPVYAYGDVVAVKGVVERPRSFVGDTGRVFNYPGYLMKDGVHYILQDAVVKQTGAQSGNPVIRSLLTAKHAWLSAVSQLIPEPGAALAGGIIVGAKQSLGNSWLDRFRETGLIHIVVLSGYNLTLVANAIVRGSARLPRRIGFVLGVLGVVAFALMVGGGPTVVRASIMAVIGMLAVHVTRPNVVLRTLTLAGFLMILCNPFVLVFDPGFQLSFVATLGLVLGAPIVSRFIPFVPESFQLREIVSATLATQFAVLPLLLYQIGQVSLVAPIVNVLVLPLVPVAMFAGFAAGLVGIISSVAAMPFAWVTHWLMVYVFVVVDVFSRFRAASVTLPPTHWSVVCLLYLLFIYLWWACTPKTARTKPDGM